MRHARPLLLLLAFAVLACAPDSGDEVAAETVRTGADTLPALEGLARLSAAATWTGPETGSAVSTVTLFPDGTYRQRTSTPGDSTLAVAHGRFEVARTEARVSLWGGRSGPQRFALIDSITWRGLGTSGTDDAAGRSTEWRRATAADPIAEAADLTGAFVYFADAALFTECASGKQYPVAMEGAYVELEQLYGTSPAAGGAPAVARVRARIGDAPAAEGDGRMTAVIVEQVHHVGMDGECEALATRRALDGNEFALVELEGVAVDTVGTRGGATLRLNVSESRVAGSDGCNRFTGRGVLRGVELVAVGPLAGTRMMCADEALMARAERYTQLLADGGWFRLTGDTLVLSRGPRVVARFTRSAPAQR